MYGLFCGGLVWSGAAAWLWITHGIPPTEAVDVWEYYYPPLRNSGIHQALLKPQDGTLDVLMLGASTIEHGWGNIEELLLNKLQAEFGPRVRIFNLAQIAHTSRDSLLKMRHVRHQPFNVVIVYDGINDCRMNCCPRQEFRDDYSHCSYYPGIEKRFAAGQFSFSNAISDQIGFSIPLGEPELQWLEEGKTLKTPPVFRKNLKEILQLAQEHRSLVVLQSFAIHLPENYTDELFEAGKLDFPPRGSSTACPVRMWGVPEGVRAGVAAHNQVVRELAAEHSLETMFVDQAAEIPAQGKYFIDVCHFTPEGCRRWVENLAPPLIARLRERTF